MRPCALCAKVLVNAGEQIGSRVANGYVSEATLEKLTAEQGPCAAAQLLRTKGANR